MASSRAVAAERGGRWPGRAHYNIPRRYPRRSDPQSESRLGDSCATDIAFSGMIARLIFPAWHPAIPFLLLLTIADDALALLILAVFYPSGPLSVIALATLMTAAVFAALWLRRRRVRSFWPYVVRPSALSSATLRYSGLHPALALVPIVPLMPHSARARAVRST